MAKSGTQYICLTSLLLCVSLGVPRPSAAQGLEPTEAAIRVANEIRREALLPNDGPDGRPLPLASHWNTGVVRGTFAPAHQIQLLQDGHHILPWMSWPSGDPGKRVFSTYFRPLVAFIRQLSLPISIRGTQWNAMLVDRRYQERADGPWAGILSPEGKRVRRLSPFGDIEPWRDPADAYVATRAMRWLQKAYPDPPLILLVSNNEPRELRWSRDGDLEDVSKRYLDRFGPGKSNEFKRDVVAKGWMERYPVMFTAMRAAFISDIWRQNVRFIGYGAFGPPHFGRWGQWKAYSLTTNERIAPDWYYWDGASVSYYTNNWNKSTDYRVFSPQIESMNWLFMLEAAWRVNPEFWFEMSTWDGNSVSAWMQGLTVTDPVELVVKSSTPLRFPEREALSKENLKHSQALQYMKNGQDYPVERAAGWVQFGLWLLRPRVVREFRDHRTQLHPVRDYWMETVEAVDRVYENDILERFWRFGRLVPNPGGEHPYQVKIPEAYRKEERWFLLDTDLAPPRPWDQTTEIPIFSLAYEMGDKGDREWLIYAHSPLKNRDDVEITIPGYGPVRVSVTREGSFYLVKESDAAVSSVR